jgi:8-oxo-dGTP pyrophosphatase MutT (NUDIX family)
MSTLRVRSKRLVYRLAYNLLHVSAIFAPRHGRGVKCLLTHAGEVLLVRHTYGKRDVWYLPGGGVHRHEHPIAAGAREMAEELGLHDLALRELSTVSLRFGHVKVKLTVLHAELEQKTLHPDPVEIAHACWFASDRLPPSVGPEVSELIDCLQEQRQAQSAKAPYHCPRQFRAEKEESGG